MAANSANISIGIDDSNFLNSLNRDLNDFTRITRLMETAGQIEMKVNAASTQKVVSDFKATIDKINKLKGTISIADKGQSLMSYKLADIGKTDMSTIKNIIKTLEKNISQVNVKGGVNNDVKQTIELLQKAVDMAAMLRNEANKLSMIQANGKDSRLASLVKEYANIDKSITKLKANLKSVSADSSLPELQKHLSQLNKIANTQRSGDAALGKSVYAEETKAIEAEIAKIEQFIAAKKREKEVRKLDRQIGTQQRNYEKASRNNDLVSMRNAKSKQATLYETRYNNTGEYSARIKAEAARAEVAAIQAKIEARKRENKQLEQAIALEEKARRIEETIAGTGNQTIADLKRRVTLSNQLVETYKKLQSLTGMDYSQQIANAKRIADPVSVKYSRDTDRVNERIDAAKQKDDLNELKRAYEELARINERMAGYTGKGIFMDEAKDARNAASETQKLIQAKREEEKQNKRIESALKRLKGAEQDFRVAHTNNNAANTSQYNAEIMALKRMIAARRELLAAKGKSAEQIANDSNIRKSLEHLALLRQGKDALMAQNRAYTLQKSLLKQLHNLATRYFGLYAIINFAKKIAETTGYFQQQKVALESITQDAQKASNIFRQLQDFSIKSPFEFKELVSFTKQLSAFQIPTDELFDTTKKLADISAGLGVDMQRIILAYGQVRSASVLRGQELRQFTEAGIPLVDELAKKFSVLEGRVVSTGEVFKRISERQVSFEMVKEILFSLTEEGGRFNNMQEKLADTTYGQIMNLKDAWNIALNDIGNSTSGIINSVLKLFRSLIDNWRATLGTVLGLISGTAIYVAYGKLISMGRKLAMSVETLKDKWLVLQKVVKRAGATMKAAMGGLVLGAAATVLGAVIGQIANAIHESKKLKKELAEIDSNASSKITSLTTNFRKLTMALQEAAEGSEEERVAYEKLLSTYSEYLPKQDLELENLRNLTDGYNNLTSAIIAKVRAQAKEEKTEAIMKSIGKDIERAARLGFVQSIGKKIDDEIRPVYEKELVDVLTNNISKSSAELEKLVYNLLEKYTPEWSVIDRRSAASLIVNTATKTRDKNLGEFIDNKEGDAYKAALDAGYSYNSEQFKKYVDTYSKVLDEREKTSEAVRDEVKTEGTTLQVGKTKTANKTVLRQLRDAELFAGAFKELGVIVNKDYNIDNLKGRIENGDYDRPNMIKTLDSYIDVEKAKQTDPAIISLLESISTNLQKSLTLYEQYENTVNGYLDNLVKGGDLNNGLSSLYSKFYMSPQTDLTEYVKNLQNEYNTHKQHFDQQLIKDPNRISDPTLAQAVREDISGMAYLKQIARYLNIDLDANNKGGGGGSVAIQSELSDFINSLKKAYETYRDATQKGGIEMGLGYVRNDPQLQEMFGEFFGGKDSKAFQKLNAVNIGSKSVGSMIQDKFITGGLENGIMDFEKAAKAVQKELMEYYEGDKKHRVAYKNAANELLKWIETTIAKDNLNVALEKLEKEVKDLTSSFEKVTKTTELYSKLVENGTDKTLGKGLGVTREDVTKPTSLRQKDNISAIVAEYNKQVAVLSNGEGQNYQIGGLGSISDIYTAIEKLTEARKMNADNFSATPLGDTSKTLESMLKQLIETIKQEMSSISGKQHTGNTLNDMVANSHIDEATRKLALDKSVAITQEHGVGTDLSAIEAYVQGNQTDATAIFDKFLSSIDFDVLADSDGHNNAKINIEEVEARFNELIKQVPERLRTELESKLTDLKVEIQSYNSSIGAFGSYGDAFHTYLKADEIAKGEFDAQVARGTEVGGQYNAETNSFSLNGIADPEKLATLNEANKKLEEMGKNGGELAKKLKQASLQNMQKSITAASKSLSTMVDAVSSVINAAKSLISAFNSVFDAMNDGENPEWMTDAEGFLEDFGGTFEQLIAPITAVIAMISSLTVAITICETAATPLIAMTAALVVLALVVAGIVAAFQQHDRSLQHDIDALNDKIEEFDNAITNLKDTAEREVGLQKLSDEIAAVGLSLTKASAAAAQAAKEDAKKNTDEDKLDEYRQNYTEAMNEFKNELKSLVEDITASTDDWASSMGDAIRSAFQNGENAARAFRDTVKTMIGDVVENMLEMAVLQPLIDSALQEWTNYSALQSAYTSKYYDKKTKSTLSKLDSTGYMNAVLGNIMDADKAEDFSNTMTEIGNTMIDVVDNLPEFLKDAWGYSSSSSSLSGGIESITEDTARRLEALSNSQLGEMVLIRTLLQDYMMGGSSFADIQTSLAQMNSNVAMLVNLSQNIHNEITQMRYTTVQPLHVTMV